MNLKSEIVKELVIRCGGRLIEERPKFIRFEASAGEVIYSHMDESIELNGDIISISELEKELNNS